MKNHKQIRFLFFCLFLLLTGSRTIYGQALALVQSVPVNKPGAVSIDRLGQVLVTDARNNLLKFDPAGKLLVTFSPPIQGHLAQVEAWNPVRIMLFYDERQQIVLLDRFLTPMTTLRLRDLTDGIIRTATLSGDDQFWLLDESDFTLLKLDPRYPEARLRTNLNQVLPKARYDFRLLREYQNNLYLLDRTTGLYVFDNMGNYRKTVPVPGLSQIGFRGEEAYYLQDNRLVFLNLYTWKEQTLSLPAEKHYHQVLAGDNQLYLFSENSLDIYRLSR